MGFFCSQTKFGQQGGSSDSLVQGKFIEAPRSIDLNASFEKESIIGCKINGGWDSVTKDTLSQK